MRKSKKPKLTGHLLFDAEGHFDRKHDLVGTLGTIELSGRTHTCRIAGVSKSGTSCEIVYVQGGGRRTRVCSIDRINFD